MHKNVYVTDISPPYGNNFLVFGFRWFTWCCSTLQERCVYYIIIHYIPWLLVVHLSRQTGVCRLTKT